MDSGTTAFPSILDKPLNQLTEDDISQLTREDCRKFLKEKGMRRPSWNKSQAIQQVISLKALLEPTDDDSGAESLRKFSFAQSTQHSTPRGNLVSSNNSSDIKLVERDEEPILQAEEELTKSGSPGERPTGTNDNENNANPRTCANSATIGQMIIFYCGEVNVFDEVSLDKAQVIMHLAASPLHSLRNPLNKNTVATTSVCQLQTTGDRGTLADHETTIFQTTQPETEGQASRKVSVQRYLEKRKDRGKLKNKKIAGSTSSGLEIYLNHHLKTHASNGNSSPISTRSPTQPTMRQLPACSTDNQLKIDLSLDLNDEDVPQQ